MFEKVYIKGSSFINKVGFNNKEMEVTMANGKVYNYTISNDIFIQFLFSESKGRFYNKSIKHKKAI